jgi:hypothetical protein
MAKNQHKKDILNLAEAYGSVLNSTQQLNELGPVGAAGIGMLAGGMLGGDKKSDEEDKTGHLDDKDLLKKVEDMGTAGDRLLDAARARVHRGESLTAGERDALGRDAYGKAEKDIAHDKKEDFEDVGQY